MVFNLKTPGKEELLSQMKFRRQPCESFFYRKGHLWQGKNGSPAGEGAAGLLGAGCSPGGSFLGGGRGWGAWAALPSSASSSITKDTRSSTSFKITPELVKLQKQFCRVRAVFLKSRHSSMFPEPVEGRAGAGSECLAGTAFPFGKVEASWRWRVVMEVPCECASRLQRARRNAVKMANFHCACLHTHRKAAAHFSHLLASKRTLRSKKDPRIQKEPVRLFEQLAPLTMCFSLTSNL